MKGKSDLNINLLQIDSDINVNLHMGTMQTFSRSDGLRLCVVFCSCDVLTFPILVINSLIMPPLPQVENLIVSNGFLASTLDFVTSQHFLELGFVAINLLSFNFNPTQCQQVPW